MDTSSKKIKTAVLSGLGVELDQDALGRLAAFHDLVPEWNRKVNLVSRRDVDNLIERHIVDSLAPLTFWDKLGLPPAPEVMDLGSGGGFPGVPLKICLPELRLTCVEATQKKARFIETAAGELGLAYVTVAARHSEEVKREPAFICRYDLVVCRAVAELKQLVEAAFPFLKTGGLLLAYKGQRADEEIKKAAMVMKKQKAGIKGIYSYGTTGEARKIVCLEKPENG
jgi:16S rRNA (guanine527-N7)-methyltransferase